MLTVAFQQESYTMIEDNGDQMVCLTVTSGMLSPGISVMASFTTQPGASKYLTQMSQLSNTKTLQKIAIHLTRGVALK